VPPSAEPVPAAQEGRTVDWMSLENITLDLICALSIVLGFALLNSLYPMRDSVGTGPKDATAPHKPGESFLLRDPLVRKSWFRVWLTKLVAGLLFAGFGAVLLVYHWLHE
jgi:hypothetical protein